MIRILGIDPGSICTGYGIIDYQGGQYRHVSHGVIELGERGLAQKLCCIHRELTELINEFQPAELGVEKVFMHRNVDSALKLGQARGAAIAVCALHGLEVFEYAPTQIKRTTVGRGRAGKQQVQHMIKVLLSLPMSPATDAADALAVAICHAHMNMARLRMSGLRECRSEGSG